VYNFFEQKHGLEVEVEG